MRYTAMLLAAATLLGCGSEGAGPSAVTALRVGLWGMVVDTDGRCIAGASVRLVSSEGEGQPVVQETPCDVWDGYGFTFRDLTPGVAVTIRATAPGYATKDTTVVPTLIVIRYEALTGVMITPSKE